MFEEAPSNIQSDSFRAFLKALRRHWWLVVMCLVLVPAAAFAYSHTRSKQYTATASLLVNLPSTAVSASGNATTPAQSASQLADITTLASENVIAQQTAKALGPSYANGSLPGTVTVGNTGNSDILTISAVAAHPDLAAKVANTYARQFIKFQTKTNIANIQTQLSDLNSELAAKKGGAPGPQTAAFLQQRIAQLRTQAALQNATLQLVVPATPPASPSSPKTGKIVGIGAGIGLLLGILLVVIFSVVDRRLRDPGEVEAILDTPVLGVIQQSRGLARGNSRKPRKLTPIDVESFAMVYANMRHYTQGTVRSVLVTSPSGGEGKSTVAWNLAATAARAGARVLLIESDMRRPSIGRRLGLEPAAVLMDVLNDDISLSEAVVNVDLSGYELNEVRQLNRFGGGSGYVENAEVIDSDGYDRLPRNGNGHRDGQAALTTAPAKLSVLLAGNARSASRWGAGSALRMLTSSRMRNLIRTAETQYDLVVIDSPPASVVSDAIPLIRYASGVLVVTRAGRNTREAAQRLADQLRHLRARTLGVVVNGADAFDRNYQTSSAYLRKDA